jgi:tetratricopeptide (TPR) repeat protein
MAAVLVFFLGTMALAAVDLGTLAKDGCESALKDVLAIDIEQRTFEQQLIEAHCNTDPVESASLYRRLNSTSAWKALGERHYLMGNYEVAAEAFKTAKSKAEKDMRAEARDTLDYWSALALLAGARRDQGEELLKTLATRHARVCDDEVCNPDRFSGAPVVVALARNLDERARWTEAVKWLDKLLKMKEPIADRWLLEVRLLRGICLFRLQKVKDSYVEFSKILKFQPQSAQAQWIRDHYAHAEILKRFGAGATQFGP